MKQKPKCVEEAPKKRGRGRPRGYSNLAIDPVFNEQLFRLWVSGKTLSQIVSMFSASDRKFSIDTLLEAKRRYEWDERREALVQNIKTFADEQVVLEKQKQLSAMSMIMDMNLQQIENVYLEFLNDPKNPKILEQKYWMINNIDSLKSLIDYYRGMTDNLLGPKSNTSSNDGENSGVLTAIQNTLFLQATSSMRDKVISEMKATADNRHTDKNSSLDIVIKKDEK